jgi:hypothetical protein
MVWESLKILVSVVQFRPEPPLPTQVAPCQFYSQRERKKSLRLAKSPFTVP